MYFNFVYLHFFGATLSEKCIVYVLLYLQVVSIKKSQLLSS